MLSLQRMEENELHDSQHLPGPAMQWLVRFEAGRQPAITMLIVGQMLALLILNCAMLIAWLLLAGPDWYYNIAPEDVGLFFISMPLLWLIILIGLRQQFLSKGPAHYYSQFKLHNPLVGEIADELLAARSSSFQKRIRGLIKALPRKMKQRRQMLAEQTWALTVALAIAILTLATYLSWLHLKMGLALEFPAYCAVLCIMLMSYRSGLSHRVREVAFARFILGLDVMQELETVTQDMEKPGRPGSPHGSFLAWPAGQSPEGTTAGLALTEAQRRAVESLAAGSRWSMYLATLLHAMSGVLLCYVVMQWRIMIFDSSNWLGMADRMDLAVSLMPLSLLWAGWLYWLLRLHIDQQLPLLSSLFSRYGLLAGDLGRELLADDNMILYTRRLRYICLELPRQLSGTGEQPAFPIRSIRVSGLLLGVSMSLWLIGVHRYFGVFLEFASLWVALLLMLYLHLRLLRRRTMEFAVARHLLECPESG